MRCTTEACSAWEGTWALDTKTGHTKRWLSGPSRWFGSLTFCPACLEITTKKKHAITRPQVVVFYGAVKSYYMLKKIREGRWSSGQGCGSNASSFLSRGPHS